MVTLPLLAHDSDETHRGWMRTWDTPRQDATPSCWQVGAGIRTPRQSAPTCHCSEWATVTPREGHLAGSHLLITVASL